MRSMILDNYYKYLHEQKILNGISGLLSWDQETKMPTKNTEFRSEQMAYISALMHKKAIDEEFVNLVNDLSADKTLDPVAKRSVEVTKKSLDRSLKLPIDYVERYSKTVALAHEAWVKAKTTENFSAFSPLLEQIIDLKIEGTNYIDPNKSVYDVLIDEYEEGMTTKTLDEIFPKLKKDLKELLPQIKSNKQVGIFEKINFDKHKAADLIDELVSKIGFDFNKGATAEVHHPFETSLSPNDVRINMSYYHKNLGQSITGAIHELGHGLYEQNIDYKYHKTDLSSGVSLGIHESQSRLLENMIGRSKVFSEFLYKIIIKYFPEVKKFSPEDIYNDLNIVRPSLIRIEADEVTYNLHIILRYEIEQLLLNKKIKVSQLPEVWNEKMRDLLGIVPNKLSNGCLQDVHWSMGGFGYFPTYTLGNLNAGILWNAFTKANPNWSSEVEAGNFKTYIKWFKENIWKYGSFYKASELLKNATNQEFESDSLVRYLKNKYE